MAPSKPAQGPSYVSRRRGGSCFRNVHNVLVFRCGRIEQQEGLGFLKPAQVVEIALLAVRIFDVVISEVDRLAWENGYGIGLHLCHEPGTPLCENLHVELHRLCRR